MNLHVVVIFFLFGLPKAMFDLQLVASCKVLGAHIDLLSISPGCSLRSGCKSWVLT